MNSRKSRVLRARRLNLEQLCRRELTAGDLTNPVNPLDANNDDAVSAVDALVVINHIGQQSLNAEGELVPAPATFEAFPDTNGDNQVTASDALLIINNLNAEGEDVFLEEDIFTEEEVNIDGLFAELGRNIRIEFNGNNMSATVSSPAPGFLTFSANGGSETVSIGNDLRIEASGNGNRLTFDGANIPDDLIIDVSGSNNAVRLVNTQIGDDFIYRGGDGIDGVILQSGTLIGDDVVIRAERGNDTVVLQNVQVNDDVFVYGDDGTDTLAVDGVNVGDDAIVRLGDDNDVASFANAIVDDVADIEGDRDFDSLATDVATVAARRLRPDDFETLGLVLDTQPLIDLFFG